ncbi:MAG TPA: 4Fe-4S dicluster domain-containing protein, partial [Polyangiales bacterium]|nr:4Fe-4S dicluster domain-containing protein [Polyangiales bacterium]
DLYGVPPLGVEMREELIKLNADRARERELSRRRFLQLVAASGALAATGCQPNAPEQILPYVKRPLELLPGETTAYATSLLIDGYASGLLVSTREGRPIKVEGNPLHPATLGSSNAFQQAAVLQLYDPDRAKAVKHLRQPSTWSALDALLLAAREDRGERLRVLLEPTSSELVHAELAALAQRHPRAKVTFYTPIASGMPDGVSERLFGAALVPHYALEDARVIVSLDSDLLSCPYALGYARAFAAGRHLSSLSGSLKRLYAVEAAMSVTGGMADHRLRRPAGRVLAIAAALSGRLGASHEPGLDDEENHFVDVLASDLRAQPPGHTLVVAGDRQPAAVHVLAHAINAQLGNFGRSVRFTQPVVPRGSGDQALPALVQELQAGAVDTLLMIGVNPVYDAPPELAIARALSRVKHSIYAGLYENETAMECAWFAPLSHPFESWGDGRAYDGTLSFVQPLIRPLYATRTATELLSLLAAQPQVGDRARLRVAFGQRFDEGLTLDMSEAERVQRARGGVSAAFEDALAKGLVVGTAFTQISPTLDRKLVDEAVQRSHAQPTAAGLELNFLRSPTLHDGRFANVSWLLELPEPSTKLTWDNAALMSPKTARELGIPDKQPSADDEYPVVELMRAGRRLSVPVLCLPTHADNSVSIWLGYGRQGAERLARGVGVNAYRLRTRGAESFAADLRVQLQPERYPLAFTQLHRDMLDRPIALWKTLAELQREPGFTAELKGPLPSLMPDTTLPGPQWAMSIDMGMCVGCSACVVACQAENNVPVVGKAQVRRGRAMHWLRIDAYHEHDDPTRVIHQPMLCQHCERAPCEYVCPVNATEHSPDGLNEMVYNRCVGTRFCSNNCPYKVRRFNWFNWYSEEAANQGSVELQRNPEVTVRQRGVMEKCTYCVQRIRRAEITARNEHREIKPGEVVTACQQACPTRAITFDSLHHTDTEMLRWRKLPQSYAVLHETGARPRTMYLARIDNPNPELAT